MELQRKAYAELLRWKNSSEGKSALLVEGARRVGKSYIVKQFGEKEYKSFILIDFSKTSAEILNLFEFESHDLDIFLMKLSVFYNVPLYKRSSLIIFDEVQLYPKARQLIKHLVEDGRYDYIETGSLISLKRNIQDILLPSEEDYLQMFPLDFEEFLIAMDEENLLAYIKTCFERRQALGDAIHRKAMNLFRQYLLVGGLPQAVIEYKKTVDFAKVDIVKRRILKLYRDDITKFAKGYESKVLAIFDEIPGQLSKHEKKFSLSSLEKDARFRDYEDAFIWLSEGKIVYNCFNSTDPSVGLALHRDGNTLKCYVGDTGLLVTQVLSEGRETEHETYKAILFDKLEINQGMFMENIVAQMLTATGHKLFFYSRYDRNDSQNNIEIDFLIRQGNKIAPIEVKSSRYNRFASLDKFSKKFSSKIKKSYIIHTKDYCKEGERVYLPIYMTMLL